MKSRSIVLVTAVSILAIAAFRFSRYHHHQAITEQVDEASQTQDLIRPQSKTAAAKAHPIRKIQFASHAPSASPKSKVHLHLKTLALNPAFRAANPGVDFNSLKPGDPAWKALKVPSDTPLVVLKDGSCGRQAVSAMGALSEDRLADSLEKSQAPSFVSYKTDRQQTVGDLDADVSRNECVHGVFANGTVDSARLPTGQNNLAAYLDPDTQGAPKLYDLKELAMDGKHAYEASAAAGNPTPYEIYFAGSTPERFGVTPSEIPGEPVDSGRTLMNGAGEVWFLPFPADASPTEQIADMSNAIINAVSRGANAVLVPAVDPNVLLAASQIAAANGVVVYEVPRNTSPLPVGLVDPQPIRLPTSSAYQPPK